MKINRRQFIRDSAVAVAGFGMAGYVTARSESEEKKKRPNIVLIMADDMGYETVGAYGGTSFSTPNIDKLAKDGMRFDYGFAMPICTPSRVTIMTGMYNVRNYVAFAHLDRDQTTFANLLKRKGYATCIAGKWQLGDEKDAPQHFGFDEACLWQHTRTRYNEAGIQKRYQDPGLEINGEPKDYPGSYGPDIVSDFICDFIEKKKDVPFFAYYPMILPHWGFPPTPDSDLSVPEKEGKDLQYPHYYPDMVAYTDKMMGKVVKKLDELGIRDNTLVIFTGDNGSHNKVTSEINGRMIQGGKSTSTDAGTHVPFIANWPGVIASGKVNEDMVDFTDVLPTLCDVAGAEIPAELTIDGHSIFSKLRGEAGFQREWVYAGNAVRTKRYRLHEKSGEFYDVVNDVFEEHPLDQNNLSPEAAAAKKLLESVLAKYKDITPADIKAKKKKVAKKKAAMKANKTKKDNKTKKNK